jgi:hypothetical protein
MLVVHRTEKTIVPPLSQTMKLCQKTALPEPQDTGLRLSSLKVAHSRFSAACDGELCDFDSPSVLPINTNLDVNKKAHHLQNGAARMSKIIAQQRENAADSCDKMDKVMRYGCAAVVGIAAIAAAPELLIAAGVAAAAGAVVAWTGHVADKKLDMAQESVVICTDTTKSKADKIEASKNLARTSRYLGLFEGSKRTGKRIAMMFVGNFSTVIDCLITAFESKDDFGGKKSEVPRVDERFRSAYAEMKRGLDLRNEPDDVMPRPTRPADEHPTPHAA